MGAEASAGAEASTRPEAAACAGPATPVGEPLPRHAPWQQARRTAGEAAVPLPAVTRSLADAVGHALAAPLAALTDLPAFDTSAMDGWAVSGAGPWRVIRDGILAGQVPDPLASGTARRIATGAPVPDGTSAVLRLEDGTVTGETLSDSGQLAPGRDIRPRGQECAVGTTLLTAGTTVTPVVLAVAAAAGYDEFLVHRRPVVDVLVTGDELAQSGVPRAGQVRDALSPLLPSWLESCGARLGEVRLLADQAGPLATEIVGSAADVIITTGSTSVGQTDHLHRVLREAGARLLVDSVAVRPGHPMLLAELTQLPGGQRRWLIGLPGNPLAAIAGLVTLALPLLRRLGGHPWPPLRCLTVDAGIPGHPRDVRLVPAVVRDGTAEPIGFGGPAMLRGIAVADVLAVVPPGGAPAGSHVMTLALTP
ncbi:MAG: molybdopterin molybdotransferase MoeA [Nocardiopsaceae bacterium]|nr:molybdopterin molybdotransferase MoeA [Nocardiopsaceae bacterium]